MTIEKYFNTLKNLKTSQLFWQIISRIRQRHFIKENDFLGIVDTTIMFKKDFIQVSKYLELNNFKFLNIAYFFEDKIDWNFSEHGKLWTYNLEYFDYLSQKEVTIEQKITLIKDFYDFSIHNKRVLEPYPVSLRCINIMRFTIREKLNKNSFIGYAYQELQFLHSNYEYHILGNHLLENCFAMILGGAFFKEKQWYAKAKRILYKELDEQILDDGAHFELSPMYHQIIFYRVLELIDWYDCYEQRDENFLSFLKTKAAKMLSWLNHISFANGDIPLFNDAAKGIAFDTAVLCRYAKQLGISEQSLLLSASGYRSYKGEKYEVKVDFAQVGASYQPGHSHADALGFILYYNDQPLFVEGGTSTYQIGEKRNYERSTIAHNTVAVNRLNQSEVWGGFRLGKRAKTHIQYEDKHKIKGYHDGYAATVGHVYREFVFDDNQITISDTTEKNEVKCSSYLHLCENISVVRQQNNELVLSNGVSIIFDNIVELSIIENMYAEEYNVYKKGLTIIVDFKYSLQTQITLP